MFKKTVTVLTFSILLSHTALSMEQDEQLDYGIIKRTLESKETNDLIDFVHNKDIIVFLGKTGSGKSTLINYLNNKELRVNDIGEFELTDPNDKSAMKMNGGPISETSFPGYIAKDNVLFCDMPGFGDTRRTKGRATQSLINAYFIKNVIEHAKNTKLIFVIQKGEFTSGRGDEINELLDNIENFIPNQNIKDFSGLIVTRYNLAKERLGQFTTKNTNGPKTTLYHWVENQKIDYMSDGQINAEDRVRILNLINTINFQKVQKVNIETIYNFKEISNIKDIYEKEIEILFNKLGYENLPSLEEKEVPFDVESLTQEINGLKSDKIKVVSWTSQLDELLNENNLISLLRSVSENTYNEVLKESSDIFKLQTTSLESNINKKITEREKRIVQIEKLRAEDNRDLEIRKIDLEEKKHSDNIKVKLKEIEAEVEIQKDKNKNQLYQQLLDAFMNSTPDSTDWDNVNIDSVIAASHK